MVSNWTIFGAEGFLGRHLVSELSARGAGVRSVQRDNWPDKDEFLGNVIYAAGLTADFRSKPFETARLHVDLIRHVLQSYTFGSLLYLSSTRVYRGATSTCETAPLQVQPNDPDELYNLTKLTGECLCLASGMPGVRVARLSNVIGVGDVSDVFLTSVLGEAVETGKVTLRTAPSSSKDYIEATDAARMMIRIASEGKERLYNVAAGTNVSHAEISEVLRSLGVEVAFHEDAAEVVFPEINIDRYRDEFGHRLRPFGEMFSAVFHRLKTGG
ncbi:MAG: NAD-dependent epimerase/dehydratase family protein [Rhizobiaceae bacterium]